MKHTYTTFYLDGFFSEGEIYQGLMEAYGRKALYSNAPIAMEPQDTIVGRLDLGMASEIVTNTVSAHNMHEDRFAAYITDETIDAGQRREVAARYGRMKAYALHETIRDAASEEERLVEDSGAAFCQHYNGHISYDYGYILQNGFDQALRDLAKAAEANPAKRDTFYRALSITVEGMQSFIKRHAGHARALIGQGAMGGSLAHLQGIAEVCENIAHNRPGSFREAVQLQWFLVQFTDYDSFSRYDQYMLPFYEQDVQNGRLSRDDAKAIVIDMLRRVDDNGSIINMTIGGLTPEGTDAVNDMTYLMLEATREALFKGPNLCLRLTAASSEKLWREAGITLSTGQALPALYNDDVFIPMLIRAGMSVEDANNYTLVGCSQAVIPAKSNLACDMGLYTPAKMLELALRDGFDPRIGKQVGPHTGDAPSFRSYEELYEAYRAQMRYCVSKGVALNDQDMAARKDFLSCVRTLLTPCCIEKGLGIFEGGADVYGIQGEVVGLTNTANALAAVKELVYDKQEITMPELMAALDANFEGYEGLRARLVNRAPKFGNGEPFVDGIRAEITKEIYDEILSYPCALGGFHWPGEVIFSYHMDQAPYVGALPDGKQAAAPLADSCGPSQGTDRNGATAVVVSAAKLPFDRIYTSVNLNLKFDRNLWDTQADKVLTVFKSYFQMGGCQLQVNVLDRASLLAAMEDPEAYKSLVVRVGGFSAYFTQLSREMQLEIVSRTMQNAG